MITCAVEKYAESIEEIKTLYPDHWEELALNKDQVPLDPRYDQYLALDAKGEILLAVLREDGNVFGYFIGIVQPGLHYRTCLTCIMDIFYVKPEKRNGFSGIRLFRTVEKELRRRGVKRWVVGTKLHKDAGALFRRLGFDPIEMYYSKWLGGD